MGNVNSRNTTASQWLFIIPLLLLFLGIAIAGQLGEDTEPARVYRAINYAPGEIQFLGHDEHGKMRWYTASFEDEEK